MGYSKDFLDRLQLNLCKFSFLLLIIPLPKVCDSFAVIGVDESGAFVPEETPDGVSVLDGPVGGFLDCDVRMCRHTNRAQRITQYLVPIPLALAEAI